MESEDDNFLPGEGSSGSKHKKQRMSLQSSLDRPLLAPMAHPNPPANAYGGPWMQALQPWMQSLQLVYSNPWMMAG
jgi:hypothetical protein